ncbi:histidine phosphatase family protein [Microbacterium luticocti]|uniref:histidine phosphatase family protein n=1 Tax=Microbacterium luticocti TaxID=451764 RepID=UPI00048E9442|nr:histidine phosphatase family protein [Microbacterium luticocti]
MVYRPASQGRCVVLVRHGETEWSRAARHTSVTDVELTDAGREQARRIGAELVGHPFAHVFSSPRRRARETAALAGFAAPTVLPELAEWDYGPAEGLTTREISERVGHPWRVWTARPPDPVPAEDVADVGRRADAVIARLHEAGGDAVVFAHAHLLRILAARWIGVPPGDGALLALSTGTISELGYEHDAPVLCRWNLEV